VSSFSVVGTGVLGVPFARHNVINALKTGKNGGEIKIKQNFFKKGLQNAAVCVIIIDGDIGV
jgi:hypothetical protein